MQSHQSMTMDDKRRFTTFAINFKQITQKLLLKRSEAQSQKSETSKYLAQNTCNSILFAYISDAEQETGKIIIGNNLMFKMCSACLSVSKLSQSSETKKHKNLNYWDWSSMLCQKKTGEHFQRSWKLYEMSTLLGPFILRKDYFYVNEITKKGF